MNVPRTIECFYPGNSFPAVSVTGSSCALDCKHCSRKYLEGMIPATTPDELLSVADALVERGAKGFLLSGGVDSEGKVPLDRFVPEINRIKRETDLAINAHIGLATPKEIKMLVDSGIDSFSIDIYGSDETIREVLGTQAKSEQYLDVVRELFRAGAKRVAPHICVGIHAGKLKREYDAIAKLRPLEPPVLVLISLIPTKGTAYASLQAPDAAAMSTIVKRARDELPDSKLLLGCMRSKKDRTREAALVDAGLDGIVLPSPSTVENLLSMGFTIKKRAVCCSLI